MEPTLQTAINRLYWGLALKSNNENLEGVTAELNKALQTLGINETVAPIPFQEQPEIEKKVMDAATHLAYNGNTTTEEVWERARFVAYMEEATESFAEFIHQHSAHSQTRLNTINTFAPVFGQINAQSGEKYFRDVVVEYMKIFNRYPKDDETPSLN